MEAAIEAILFVATEPVATERLLALFDDDEREAVEAALQAVIARYPGGAAQGLVADFAAGGVRLVTRPALQGYLRKFFQVTGRTKLSMAALETLAIVAYRQPVTAPEIQELRGVSTAGVLKTLLDHRLVRISGRKEVVGKPFLYGTSREFLVRFGLNRLQDLPPLEELEQMLQSQVEAEGGRRACRSRSICARRSRSGGRARPRRPRSRSGATMASDDALPSSRASEIDTLDGGPDAGLAGARAPTTSSEDDIEPTLAALDWSERRRASGGRVTPVDRWRRGAPGGERGGRAGAVYRGKPRRAARAKATPRRPRSNAAPRPRNDRKRPRKSDASPPRRDRPEPGGERVQKILAVGGPRLAPRLRRPHPRRPGHHQRPDRDPRRQGRPGARLDQGRRQAGVGVVSSTATCCSTSRAASSPR